MSTSPRVAAKLLAVTVAAAATVGIGLATATPAAADRKGNTSGGSSATTGPTNAAAQLKQRVSPFERVENAFDRFFHIPDRDDQVLQAK